MGNCDTHRSVKPLYCIQLKPFLSLHRFFFFHFESIFFRCKLQINRFFFLLSFYRFIVLSFYRCKKNIELSFLGKRHRVHSIVLSFHRFIVVKKIWRFFYRFIALSFHRFIVAKVSFYRCRAIILSLRFIVLSL